MIQKQLQFMILILLWLPGGPAGSSLWGQGNTVDSLSLERNKAVTLRSQGQYEEALQILLPLAEEARDQYKNADTLTGRIDLELGLTHYLAGDFDAAVDQ